MTLRRFTTAALVVAASSLASASLVSAQAADPNLRAEQDGLRSAAHAEFQACLEARAGIEGGESLREEQNDFVSIEDSMGCASVFAGLDQDRLMGDEDDAGENLRSQQDDLIETDG